MFLPLRSALKRTKRRLESDDDDDDTICVLFEPPPKRGQKMGGWSKRGGITYTLGGLMYQIV